MIRRGHFQTLSLDLTGGADGIYGSYWLGKFIRSFYREGLAKTTEKQIYTAFRLMRFIAPRQLVHKPTSNRFYRRITKLLVNKQIAPHKLETLLFKKPRQNLESKKNLAALCEAKNTFQTTKNSIFKFKRLLAIKKLSQKSSLPNLKKNGAIIFLEILESIKPILGVKAKKRGRRLGKAYPFMLPKTRQYLLATR